ncbi:hypothetical protein INQ30_28230, partial [Escherichia coli]|nr:hypothetical protein [Escherichia coli]
MSAFSSHTCALDDAGIGYCWGENRQGQLGRGTSGTTPEATPEPVVGDQRFARLALGSRALEFTVALPTSQI